MGPRRCGQLFMTAAVFDAAKALDYGLIHQVVSHEALKNETELCLKQLLTAGPNATKASKQLIRACIPGFDANLSETTSSLIATLRVSDEGQEGLHAFFEKRSPSWMQDDDAQ